jgi:glycine cleavage system H protein
MYPEDLRYTKDHEWVRVDGEIGIIGITDHAQELLGELVFVSFGLLARPLKAGDHIERGQTLGVVESVKTASDVYSPVAGEILQTNESLTDDPGLVNREPHGAGWLVKIRLADRTELSNLLSASDYQTYIGAEK